MPARALLALLAAAGVLLGGGCGGSSGGGGSSTTAVETGGKAPVSCQDVAAPGAREDGGATKPSERLDPEKTYELVFETSCGAFTVTLDQAQSPAAAASLVSLARAKFFDGTIFHRIVPGFVIQGGDPTQSGSGGPGYQTVDTPPPDASYVKGVVAMAKTQTEPAGTAGSQFFVVTGTDAGLPPDYAVAGTVTKGLDVVEKIGTLGDPTTEQPTRPVVIDSVTVVESP